MIIGRQPDYVYEDMVADNPTGSGDELFLSIDFTEMGVGVTLTGSPTIVVVDLMELDLTPQSRVLQSPAIATITAANCALEMQFGQLVQGSIYEMVWSCNNSNGEKQSRVTRVTAI